MSKQRVELLDGFRFIAILGVLLYHLTSPYIMSFRYGDMLWQISKYGYLGVHFFFIISGFVISCSLENTANLFSFYRNRFARLFPAMLLCSIITFIVIRILDKESLFRNAHDVKNFLPGLTFINPSLWTSITKVEFHWLNGSYWSLWQEVQFYFISSAIYFLNPKSFFRNMLIVGIGLCLIKYVPMDFLNNHPEYVKTHDLSVSFNNWRHFDEVFNLGFYICWFLFGVIFHQLYKTRGYNRKSYGLFLWLILIFANLVRDTNTFFEKQLFETLIACVLMHILFLLMIYKREYVAFLENSFLCRIGIISYSIYLIHEDIGVLLIRKYGKHFGDWGLMAPFLIIIILIGFAELSYRFYERRVSHLIKSL